MQDGDESEKAKAANADPDNNLGRGSPQDREERIRQRAHEIWERAGRPDGQAQSHWDRAMHDLDREDAELQRVADQKPGIKPLRESKEKPDATST